MLILGECLRQTRRKQWLRRVFLRLHYFILESEFGWGNLSIIRRLAVEELRGFGPLANYADRVTAACWRSSANFCG
jgi:hypothetical protein